MVNTRFWSDNFVSELNPLDRYLFLYFLTNEHTNISGIYELPLKSMAFETGIEIDMLKKMIKRLFGKVFYLDGWVCIKNFQKHQSTTSTTVKKGIEIEMAKIPDNIKKKIEEVYPMDTLSGGIIYLNLNSNLNSNSNSDGKPSPSVEESNELIKVIDAFKEVNPTAYKKWYVNKTQRKSVKNLLALKGVEKLLDVIAILPKTNNQNYYPKITSPFELEEKWSKLEATLMAKKDEKLKANKKIFI